MADPVKGTPVIGLTAQIAFDDNGNGTLPGNGTHVPCVNVTSLGFPSKKLGTIESKTLDLSNYTISKIAGLFDPGQVTFSWELVNANTTGNGTGQLARLEALVNTRLPVPTQWRVPTDGGNYTITKNAIVVQNEPQPAEPDGKLMCTTTLDITG